MGYAKKSPWVIHYDGSSCNGCDIEVLAALCPGFDAERFGVINTGNPKHADIFLVTGSVNEQNKAVVKQIYDQMVEPKVVAACGICACTGGIFKDCYNVSGGVDSVIPVDVYVPGCAVRPESIIDAVVQAIEALDAKSKALKDKKLNNNDDESSNKINKLDSENINNEKTEYSAVDQKDEKSLNSNNQDASKNATANSESLKIENKINSEKPSEAKNVDKTTPDSKEVSDV